MLVNARLGLWIQPKHDHGRPQGVGRRGTCPQEFEKLTSYAVALLRNRLHIPPALAILKISLKRGEKARVFVCALDAPKNGRIFSFRFSGKISAGTK